MRFEYSPVFATLFALFVLQVGGAPLHILLIVIDDWGWSDVGFHGAKIKTPNMDKLASEGVILDNYYVQPVCTPTRAALLTGRYPIHTGLQRGVIRPDEPYGLPLQFTTLPQKLKEAGNEMQRTAIKLGEKMKLTVVYPFSMKFHVVSFEDEGYSTHMVGKWHLGFFKWPYTPTYRGFDSFYGLYTGHADHYTYVNRGFLDLRDDKKPIKPAEDKEGAYSARLFTEQAKNIIQSHDALTPLFLYLSFINVHSPLQAPKKYLDKYRDIKSTRRRRYAAMVDIVDEAIGHVTEAMKKAGLWDNTLLIVSTDNGGEPRYGGYNWPLRGKKNSLWEGGVRGIGFVHGKMLQRTGVKCKELFHVTDWYPTLLHLAGISEDSTVPPLDGFNIWRSLSEGAASPRTEILLNIAKSGTAIRSGDMKLLMNVPNHSWYQPPELDPETKQEKKPEIKQVNMKSPEKITVALYNITADPTERVDLSETLPDVVEELSDRVQCYMKGVVPSGKKRADPKAKEMARETGYWGPWRS